MQSNQMAIITIDWTFDGMILNFENNPERMLIPYRPLSLAKDGSKSQLAVSELSSSCLPRCLDILSTILAASSDAIVALATLSVSKIDNMESGPKPSTGQTSLFQVYLRLRPPMNKKEATQIPKQEYLTVERPEPQLSEDDGNQRPVWPTHITLQPPNDSRKRAVEKFGFTKVFEENASQLELFEEIGMPSLIKGVLCDGRDGLVATLGVTGSGKTHTILGSKSQRGITQMSLDVLFRSLSSTVQNLDNQDNPLLLSSIADSDPSEAQLFTARSFIEMIYSDPWNERGRGSRAQTPMSVVSRCQTPMTDSMSTINFPRRHLPHRPSTLPQSPDVSEFVIPNPSEGETVVLVSMYEVYNDRIFDLLTPLSSRTSCRPAMNQKERRRHLLFKPTEASPDRKVVAGLRKVICGTYEEALMVLETGLLERKVTGTGSNSVSSRSHGFFCVEVKRRVRDRRFGEESWIGNTLTVVDLAGSERARNAKTAGATLAEAGKINESLMYLGQCLQTQSDFQDGNKNALVPYRQCKLTELLFSNSFPSPNHGTSYPRHPQRALMIVTADAQGDFNATSQILRYSALAREVTVPRIPSVTSTILANTGCGRKSPTYAHANKSKSSLYCASAEELETAALEIAKISDDYDALAVKLAEEEIARAEAEFHWRAAEERCMLIEQEVREECWQEMEQRLEEEKRRWQAAWGEQESRHDEHLDKKLDLLSRGVRIHEDPQTSSEHRIIALERDNDNLRKRVASLERELHSRSPTKKATKSKKNLMPQQRQDSLDYSYASCESDVENSLMKLQYLKLDSDVKRSPGPISVSKKLTGGRRQRMMTARQRDFAPESVLDELE
ncbi:kinesin family protein [Blastomyces dermatitidis ER-3]|uniref:Kinesin family protein n=1 Tax=Ajellomyces dermatitidis (strain ER-3 / ATCC MYA-2586) TaxID=559297 RepID=A0ABP2ELX2_AJEDR|nr:kinesin family protein [Blastomyces dermatitidis ER-3]EEQ84285.1 kinesin family protein [Blastomyces dermatitidis ER-3]